MRPGKKTISDVGGRSEKRGEVVEKENSSVSLLEDIKLDRFFFYFYFFLCSISHPCVDCDANRGHQSTQRPSPYCSVFRHLTLETHRKTNKKRSEESFFIPCPHPLPFLLLPPYIWKIIIWQLTVEAAEASLDTV